MERLAILVPVLAILAVPAVGAPGAPADYEIPYTVMRLSSRVIVLDCLNVNVTALATDSGVVVIDTNRSPGVMRQLRRVIEREFGRQDFVYVVNTHGDPDHASGNPAFPSVPLVMQRGQASYVGHAKAARLRSARNFHSRLDDARARYESVSGDSVESEALRGKLSELELMEPELRDGELVAQRAIPFGDSLTLNLGDLNVELHFFGEAHTTHDTIVYVPEERLLLSGDLICSPRSPCFSIDAMTDVPRLVGGLEGILQRKTGLDRVVPGHGRVLSRSELEEFCRTLSEQAGSIRVERSAAWILGKTIEREGIRSALERYPPPAPGEPRTLDWSEGELGTLGVRLMRRGMTAEAVSILGLAVTALPESGYLYGCLGDACLEADDIAAAVAAYGKSLSLVPENRHAAEMLKILR